MNFYLFKDKLTRLTLLFLSCVLTLVVVSFSPLTANTPAKIEFVSPSWVTEHAQDPKLKILDVRINPLEYIDSHLPQAVHFADNTFRGLNGFLPVQYWDAKEIAGLFSKAGINNDSHVLVYSDGNNVLESTMVAYLLERSGAKNIAVLDGGYKGYKDSNSPLVKEFPRYKEEKFTLRDNPSVRVTLA